MQIENAFNETDLKIARAIAELGAASETEIQSRTLTGLASLREEIGKMEKLGYIRRRRTAFTSGYEDALELTEQGYRKIR